MRGEGHSTFLWGSLLLVAALGSGSEAAAGQADLSTIVLGLTYDAHRADASLAARVERAYFDQVNANGGIRGRKIRFVVLDDQGDPARAQTNLHQLADRDNVLVLLNSVAITNDVPYLTQLFPKDRTLAVPAMGMVIPFYPPAVIEGSLIGEYILAYSSHTKVAAFQGSDAADEQLVAGLRQRLGVRAMLEVVSGTTNSMNEIVRKLQATDADVLVIAASPAVTAMVLSITSVIDWKPERIINSDAAYALRIATPAVRGAASGSVSLRYLKDPHDPKWSSRPQFHFAEFPRWVTDRDAQAYHAFVRHQLPEVNDSDEIVEYAYTVGQLVVRVLEQCRDRVSRASVSTQALRQSWSDAPLLSPAIRIYNFPGQPYPINEGQPIRFDGEAWSEIGEVLDAGS